MSLNGLFDLLHNNTAAIGSATYEYAQSNPVTAGLTAVATVATIGFGVAYQKGYVPSFNCRRAQPLGSIQATEPARTDEPTDGTQPTTEGTATHIKPE